MVVDQLQIGDGSQLVDAYVSLHFSFRTLALFVRGNHTPGMETVAHSLVGETKLLTNCRVLEGFHQLVVAQHFNLCDRRQVSPIDRHSRSGESHIGLQNTLRTRSGGQVGDTSRHTLVGSHFHNNALQIQTVGIAVVGSLEMEADELLTRCRSFKDHGKLFVARCSQLHVIHQSDIERRYFSGIAHHHIQSLKALILNGNDKRKLVGFTFLQSQRRRDEPVVGIIVARTRCGEIKVVIQPRLIVLVLVYHSVIFKLGDIIELIVQ